MLAGSLTSSPPARGASDDCALTSRQKAAAVKAFKALAPIFQDARCLNCHGVVNPFARDGGHVGGHVDIREEARKFLQAPDPRSAIPVGTDPTGAFRDRVIRGIREVAESPVEITDNDLIRNKALEPMLAACRECHVDEWRIPMRHNYFTGRDWQAMCVHMKTSSLTDTPVEFLQHMQDDDLVLDGFKGLRGLKDPTTAEPPAMPFDTMVRYANDWIAAMDGRYHPPEDCGCKADGIVLEITHRLWSDPDSGSSRAGRVQFDGTLTFDVLLKPMQGAPEGWFRDEVTVIREVEVRHVKPAFIQCAGSGYRDEEWLISARFDADSETLSINFGFTDEGQEASWTCTAPGYSSTEPVYMDLSGDLEELEIPAGDTAAEASGQNAQQFETIRITVIDNPYAR